MRKCGILLSISSLPSKYGIGTLGKGAYDFVDFLKKAGQTFWQILPVSPVSFGNSPYQSPSAFAFNPYYIDPDILVGEGLLSEKECLSFDFGKNVRKTDYAALWENRKKLLFKAAQRFPVSDNGYRSFCEENDFWLSDYALFAAFKENNGNISLKDFPDDIKHRKKEALDKLAEENEREIEYHKITQYLFFKQWLKLKKYANDNGVHIIGDIPVYVSADSCDVWAAPELFSVDESLSPVLSAGCPPDSFSSHGQLWGNPVYKWNEHRKTDYEWWIKRFTQANQLFDVTRIDHFRGFYSYYAVPHGEKTAENGKWYEADGEALMKKVKEKLPQMKIIAEDLGFITPRIKERMAKSGFPGMKIIEFGFDTDGRNEHLPHNFEKNSVVYTGTHDNSTAMGWLLSSRKECVEFAMDYFGVNFIKNLPDAMIRGAFSSVSDTAIIPMQDYLKQGDESRMNIPSTVSDNWTYRITDDDMNDNLADRLYRQAKIYNRL